jgi:adenine C2-methylase RlmN of 23S rRNA A2503 and tRNA A37
VYAQLWKRSASFAEMTDLPSGLRDRLQVNIPIEVEIL